MIFATKATGIDLEQVACFYLGARPAFAIPNRNIEARDFDLSNLANQLASHGPSEILERGLLLGTRLRVHDQHGFSVRG